MRFERATIETSTGPVGAAWSEPDEAPGAHLVFAHGAGGSLETPQVKLFGESLAGRGIGVVRFNFPYVERGRKSPGSPKESIAAWKDVADFVRQRGTLLFVGGKSYGGRMASHAVAEGCRASGLVFLGYPLHAPATPERLRDEHLSSVQAPMLFLQGTRDAFARQDLIQSVVGKLSQATLVSVDGGDHSFAVRGRKMPDVIDELAAVAAEWITKVSG